MFVLPRERLGSARPSASRGIHPPRLERPTLDLAPRQVHRVAQAFAQLRGADSSVPSAEFETRCDMAGKARGRPHWSRQSRSRCPRGRRPSSYRWEDGEVSSASSRAPESALRAWLWQVGTRAWCEISLFGRYDTLFSTIFRRAGSTRARDFPQSAKSQSHNMVRLVTRCHLYHGMRRLTRGASRLREPSSQKARASRGRRRVSFERGTLVLSLSQNERDIGGTSRRPTS